MCGIVGYKSENPTEEDLNLLQKIIFESKIRGLHSFGYSYLENGQLITEKYHDIKEIKLPIKNKIIYHNRYATSGDYKDHKNNQPIHTNDMSLVFNGVLDMRTKQEMEEYYEITMQTDNDGEVLIQLCGLNPVKIKDFVNNTKGSFAGIILTENNKMYAIRNKNRPCWILKRENATFIASTEDIFKRVDGSLKPTKLKSGALYEL